MVIDMQEESLDSIERLEQVLEGTVGVAPRVQGGEAQRQDHVRRVLGRMRYSQLSRRDKGVVVRYLQHTSGYSRQHLVRLIGRFVARRPLGQRRAPVRSEEHTSELQSLMRISYAVFCLKQKTKHTLPRPTHA